MFAQSLYRKVFSALLTLSCLAFAAQSAANTNAHRTDSLANVLMNDGKYEDAIKMLNRTASSLDSEHPDSLYIQSFVKMGYCYDRLENPMKAIEMTKMAIFLREASGSPENLYLANLYDNIALAYHKLNQNKEAELWISKALAITARYKNANDVSIRTESHASLIAKALERLDDAVVHQKKAIHLIEVSKGKYSDAHLENLAALRGLYVAMADSDQHRQTSEYIRQLKDEIAQGVLPGQLDLSTPRLCRRHNTEVLLCCRWILGNYVTTEGMKTAVELISEFYKHTPDVAVYIGKNENAWAKKLNSVYLMAYIAASADYALRNPDDLRYSVLQYKYAMNKVLDYYEANKKITGTIPVFDGYLRQRENNPDKFDKTLSKNFREFCNEMKTRKPYEFDVEAPTIMTFSY